MLCPNTNTPEKDVVYTPRWLAADIISHFNPTGKILEPCRGDGAFSTQMDCEWCEIAEGVDFFDYSKKVDWIVTNPPWSKIRQFLDHSFSIEAENIVFLCNINAVATRARLNLIRENGYGIAEFYCMDNPKEGNWPQTGFQLAAIHIKRNYSGSTKWNWRVDNGQA